MKHNLKNGETRKLCTAHSKSASGKFAEIELFAAALFMAEAEIKK